MIKEFIGPRSHKVEKRCHIVQGKVWGVVIGSSGGKGVNQVGNRRLVPGCAGRKNEGWPRKETLGYEQEWES